MLVPKSISKFEKFEKFENEKSFSEIMLVSLLSDSLQFQKQLITKSETRLGFKPLGNH